jgi:hypothetical protein
VLVDTAVVAELATFPAVEIVASFESAISAVPEIKLSSMLLGAIKLLTIDCGLPWIPKSILITLDRATDILLTKYMKGGHEALLPHLP